MLVVLLPLFLSLVSYGMFQKERNICKDISFLFVWAFRRMENCYKTTLNSIRNLSILRVAWLLYCGQ